MVYIYILLLIIIKLYDLDNEFAICVLYQNRGASMLTWVVYGVTFCIESYIDKILITIKDKL